MTIHTIPPTSAPTTAGQLAARATQNDQALAAWLGELDGRVDDVESRSGTSVFSGMVPTFDDLPDPVGRDGQAWVVLYDDDGTTPDPRMYVSNGSPEWGGPVSIEGAATEAAVAAAIPSSPVRDALAGIASDVVAAGAGWEVAAGTHLGHPTYATVQAAATAAASNGKRLYAAGSYTTNQTLSLASDADLSGLTIHYTGTDTPVQVGTEVSALLDRDISLPRVYAANKSGTGWASVAGTVGYRLVNIHTCRIVATFAQNFETNMVVHAVGTGTVHNEFHLGYLRNGRTNLRLSRGTGGWTNQNVFIGGRLSHLSAEGLDVPGVKQIDIEGGSVNPINSNTFLGTSVEYGTAEWHLDCGGVTNVFDNVRWEVQGGARVRWGAIAVGNVVRDGYGASTIKQTWVAGSSRNQVKAYDAWGHQSNQPMRLANTTSSAQPIMTIMDHNGVRNDVDPLTAYRWSFSADMLKAKRATEEFDRLRLDGLNGRLYFGTGNVEPAYIGMTAGRLRLEGLATSTAATAGEAAALPATPAGYLRTYVNGSLVKIPYFAD